MKPVGVGIVMALLEADSGEENGETEGKVLCCDESAEEHQM